MGGLLALADSNEFVIHRDAARIAGGRSLPVRMLLMRGRPALAE
jgi:hypothetical protein